MLRLYAGQYLLDNEILTYVGDVVQEANGYNDSEDDDEDLLCVNGTFFCPVNKKRQKTFNDVLIAGSPGKFSFCVFSITKRMILCEAWCCVL